MNEEDFHLLTRLLDKVDEVGECMIWNGATSTTGHPQIKVWGCGCRYARREMYRIAIADLKPRMPIDTRCNERKCINPEHLFQSTVSNIGKKAGKRGVWTSLTRSKKISEKKRAHGKLTIEIAREIRMSSESGPVLALKYGVSRSLITQVKRGVAWRDYSNPYLGLMAA